MSTWARRLALAVLAWALAGCGARAWPDQPATSGSAVSLAQGLPLGQSFVTLEAGLQGVEVYLSPEAPGDASSAVSLLVRPAPGSAEVLAAASLPLSTITQPGFYTFAWAAPLPGARRADYYAELSLSGPGRLAVGTGQADSYADGALYQQGSPVEAQLAFRLVYAGPRVWAGRAAEAAGWGGWLALALVVFALPGWALLGALRPAGLSLPWAERLAVAAGLGLALAPVWLLLASLVRLRLGALNAWLPALLAAGLLAWQARRASGPVQVGWPQRLRAWRQAGCAWPDLALAGVLALVFAARFWTARQIDVPLWGDSVQHAMMAQLMVDHGGLFESWAPYTPYNSLTVQYGFAAVAAMLDWAAPAGSVRATLVAGQLLNGLAVFALYPLAVRLARGNRWAGVGAVLAAGLLSPMPGYYVNWGRYAQLAGQAILPVALWLLWAAVEARSRRLALLAGLALAGMTLAYYRMPFYYAAFVALWLPAFALPRWRADVRQWAAGLAPVVIAGVFGIALALPWLPRLLGSNLADFVEAGLSPEAAAEALVAYVRNDFQIWRSLTFYAPVGLLLAAAAGWGLSLIRRRWEVAVLPLWFGLLAAYVVGMLLGLPGANMLQNFALIIAAYLPLALLAGWLLGEAAEAMLRRRPRWAPAGLAVVVGALALWGFGRQATVADRGFFAIATRPDVRAAAWIQQHTPANARFLVEGFRYQFNSAVGSDGGWWLPLLAGRANTMPPQYALLNEAPAEAGYTQRVVELVAALEAEAVDSPAVLQQLCGLGITHAYVGQRQGLAGFNATQLFSIAELAASPAFEPIYRHDRVAVFALKPEVCAASS